MEYFKTLSETDRQRLFEYMRLLDSQADLLEAEHRRLCPKPGEVAVGAAFFDPWLKAEARRAYILHPRLGKTPDAAEKEAIEWCRLCVRRHNEKSKDVNWARCEDSATALVEKLRKDTPAPIKES